VCRAGQFRGASLLRPSSALFDSLLRAYEREEAERESERERGREKERVEETERVGDREGWEEEERREEMEGIGVSVDECEDYIILDIDYVKHCTVC
jgi:hypothetical protein